VYAIGYSKSRGARNLLAIVRNDGTGYRELLVGELADPSVQGALPLSWSWDNRSLLILVLRAQEFQVLSVSVADASTRVLITRPGGGFIGNAVFSPDGRFVAYAQSGSSNTEFFIVPVHGGQTRRVYQDRGSMLFDWTADGRSLIFRSSRSGTSGLYL